MKMQFLDKLSYLVVFIIAVYSETLRFSRPLSKCLFLLQFYVFLMDSQLDSVNLRTFKCISVHILYALLLFNMIYMSQNCETCMRDS